MVPYVYKDGTNSIFTEAYEDASYNYPSWDWYEMGLQSDGEAVWTEPYFDEESDMTMVTTSVPFFNNGQKMGVVTADIDLTTLQNHISQTDLGGSGFVFLSGETGQYIAHTVQEKVMTASMFDPSEFGAKFLEETYVQGMINEFEYEGENHQVYISELPSANWKVGLAVPDHVLYAPLQNLLIQLTIATLIVAGIGSVIIFVFSNRLTYHIQQLKDRMERVANGDLTVKASVETNDEIGLLAIQFNKMTKDMNSLLTSMGKTVYQLRDSSEQLSATSEETIASSQEINHAIQEVAVTATSMSEQTNETSHSVNDLASSIERVLQKMNEMNKMALKQENSYKNGMTQVNTLQESSTQASTQAEKAGITVQTLSTDVDSIESIVAAIQGISEQTNLLALNASIEAARAGEHGKGFAVVASEVRKLAEETTTMTDQIKQQLSSVKNGSTDAVQSVQAMRQSSEQQLLIVNETKDVFEQLMLVTKELSQVISTCSNDVTMMNEQKEVIVRSLEMMNDAISQTASASEEITASSDEQVHAVQSVAEAAEMLYEMSEDANKKVSSFTIEKEE